MINNYDRHRFSEMTRQYSTDDLVASIKQEGQLVPAILWNDGEKLVLVDGYHRQKACQELGIGLKVTELPEGTEEHQIPKKNKHTMYRELEYILMDLDERLANEVEGDK